MKNKILSIILIIIILLIISLLFLAFLVRKDYSNKVDNTLNNVKVLVAKEDIDKGSIINDSMVEIKLIKAGEMTDNYITNIHDVIEKTTTDNIKKGDKFTYSNLK